MTEHDDVVDLLQRAVDVEPADDEQIAAIAATARRRRRTAQRMVTAIGALAVLAIAVIVPLNARSTRIDLAEEPAAPARQPAAWRELPPAPLDARWGAFSAYHDDGLIIWGGYAAAGADGEGPRGDGAAYWNDRWSALPGSPLGPRMRMHSAAGWIDDVRRDGTAASEYWIVAGTGGADGTTPMLDAAAYRPERVREGRWYELPDVPESIVGGAVVSGASMVVVAEGSGGPRAVYELAPGDEQWHELEQPLPPPDPSAVDNSDLHVLDAGGHVVVVGLGEMFMLPSGVAPTVNGDRGDGLEWQRVPPPDDAHALGNVRGAVADVSRDGGAVVVMLSDGTYRYDIADSTWSRIAGGVRPDPPQPIPLVQTYDDTVVAVDVVGGHVHALSDDGAGWSALPPLDGPRINAVVEVADGSVPGFGAEDGAEAELSNSIVVWGGMGSEEPGAAQGVMLTVPQDVDP